MYRRGDLATIPGQERMKISSQVRLARPVQEDPPAQDNIRASALDSNQIYLLLLFRLDIRSQTGSIPGRFQGFGNPAWSHQTWWWLNPDAAVGHSFGGTGRLSGHLGNRNKLSCPRHDHHLHSRHHSPITQSGSAECRAVCSTGVPLYQTAVQDASLVLEGTFENTTAEYWENIPEKSFLSGNAKMNHTQKSYALLQWSLA